MNWFDEQIRQRKENDQEVFEDSIFRMASVITGNRNVNGHRDDQLLTRAAIADILAFFRKKAPEIPGDLRDPEEQLDYCLRPYGLMRRSVKLEEGWYKDSFGPILAFRKEDGLPVALLPNAISGYHFRDPVTREATRLSRSTAGLFESDAYCFYRPLPLKKIGIPDLILYLKNCLSTGDLVILLALTLMATLFGMVLTNVNRALTGYVPESGSSALLWGTAAFLVISLISTQLVSTTRELMMHRVETRTSLSVEAAVMMRIMNLPANFFREYSSGELSSRFSSVTQLCDLLLGNVFSTGLTSVFSLLYIFQIFHYAPALVLPSIGIILLNLAFSILSAMRQIGISKQIMERSAKSSGLSFALITGVQKIRLSGSEKRAFSKWATAYSDVAGLQYNPPWFIKANAAITTAISLFGTILLYSIAVKTNVSPSEFIAFNTAYGTVAGAFGALTGVALSVAQIKPILEMAEPILKTEPESSENKSMVTSLRGGIELSNVYFRYNESMPYVVNGMNLKIRPGEYVAIVGTTGCGKSTLMRLLLGFEKPEKGAIYYDGKDMSKLDLQSLRRRIGAVTQNGSLFQGDIYSNIVISAPHLDLQAAWDAAELAGIADDIRAMPMGMQTILSEGQGGISGGQKQRLMIARAVAPKPKILMFDEATSALDNKTQKQVSEALDSLSCTRIVIAHRLSTIRNCDRILVLDKGRILEDGTYDELIAQNGFFADLVARQRLDTGAEVSSGQRAE